MVSSPFLPWIVGLPLLGAVVNALGRNRLSRRAVAWIGCASVALAFAAAGAALLQLRSLGGEEALGFRLWRWASLGQASVELGLLGDPLSLWFALVVTGVGLLIHVYSVGYMADDDSFGRYFAELNYFVFAMSLLVLSSGLVSLLIGWANVGLSSYLLIGFWHRREAAARAATKAFLINQAGEVAMLLALYWTVAAVGQLQYQELFAHLGGVPQATLTGISLLLFVAAAAKSAQLPLHTWLPDAMQGPTPVSALIHAATMVTAGVFLVARMWPLFLGSGTALQVVAWVGALTALFGAGVAVGQWDIKKVLAYSTMSQLGYMMLAAGVGAFTASLFHFFTHAFFKALLFLAAGVVIHHLDGEQDLRRMGGLGRSMPLTYWSFLFGVAALSGLPPFAGFFSKDEILAATLQAGEPVLWGMGLAAAALTAYYSFRLFALVFAGPGTPRTARGAHGTAGAHGGSHGEGPRAMLIPVAILAVAALVVGWLGIPTLTAVPAHFLEPVFHGRALEPEADWLTMGLSLVLALAGMLLAVRRYGRARAAFPAATAGRARLLENGFELDRLFRVLVVEPGIALAQAVGLADARGVDGAVNGLAWATGRAGERVRLLHGGQVRRYALTLVSGAALLLVYYLWIL
ncbi:NADH-quinone oxidoreductase subunit L [Limnochorda pilosa]|uniref:NADH:ubiquinone oxidoreductase subunit L n=1 Tax=Limnochorda pilosa TaxID=1555112 RepID=A0A0K2SPA5_LIMPI|nr:NADH-quinone oxidoreductase subunit L [Limnochorda pilosa]BAS28936.1 NADH:ubiquinone oxidoreductase subunit L [Limnochorda pilosa]